MKDIKKKTKRGKKFKFKKKNKNYYNSFNKNNYHSKKGSLLALRALGNSGLSGYSL